MGQVDFEELPGKVTPLIQRQDTWMREAISASERLSITLRYLATGDSYQSFLMLHFVCLFWSNVEIGCSRDAPLLGIASIIFVPVFCSCTIPLFWAFCNFLCFAKACGCWWSCVYLYHNLMTSILIGWFAMFCLEE